MSKRNASDHDQKVKTQNKRLKLDTKEAAHASEQAKDTKQELRDLKEEVEDSEETQIETEKASETLVKEACASQKEVKFEPLSEEESQKYSFRFQLNPSRFKLFHSLCESIKDVSPDVNFEFTENGLRIIAQDSSKVSLLMLELTRSFWDAYEYTYDKDTQIVCMSLPILFSKLKLAKASNPYAVFSLQRDADHLDISLYGDVHIDSQVKMMSDSSYEHISIADPDEFDLTCSMSSQNSKKLFGLLHNMSDVVMIKEHPNPTEGCCNFVLLLQDEHGQQTLIPRLEQVSDIHWSVSRNKEFKISLSTRYLGSFLKSVPGLSDKVVFRFKEEFPCSLVCRLPDQNSQLIYYLAPKIES
jgi:proliferating cell nuclear antigen PCNA